MKLDVVTFDQFQVFTGWWCDMQVDPRKYDDLGFSDWNEKKISEPFENTRVSSW